MQIVMINCVTIIHDSRILLLQRGKGHGYRGIGEYLEKPFPFSPLIR